MRAQVLSAFAAAIGLFSGHLALAEPVSVTSAGSSASGVSNRPAMSSDGRFVAFATTAKLVKDDTNGISDVYVHDRRTHRTRRVSDAVGGDQPTISANGHFVAYRSFEYYQGLPRIRVVDLERDTPSFSGAVQNLNSYYQPAGSPLLSVDGRYLAFAFSPAPNNQYEFYRDFELTVVDLSTRQATAVLSADTTKKGLQSLGQFDMSANADTFVFSTNDSLPSDLGAFLADNNTTSDVYLATRSNPGRFNRLSFASGGTFAPTGAHHPVISLDGKTVFFIADNPLTADDDDDRPSLYSFSLNPISGPKFVRTRYAPVSLSNQATISGKYIAYLGQPDRGPARASVLNIADGSEASLGTTGATDANAPILSGDDHLAACVSGGNVLVKVPSKAPPVRTPPAVTLAKPVAGLRPLAGSSFVVNSSATDSAGSISFQSFEFNGFPILSSTGPTLNATFTPPPASDDTPTYTQQFYQPGFIPVAARAFNDAWIEGKSDPLDLTVLDPHVNTTFTVAGYRNIQRVTAPDGSTKFEMEVTVENRAGSDSPATQLIVSASSRVYSTNPSYFLDDPRYKAVQPPEQVITVIDVPPIPASSSVAVTVNGAIPPTQLGITGDPMVGLGWVVGGRLRAGVQVSAPLTAFEVIPKLSENTLLPNGGIPSTGTANTDTTFNPAQLQDLQIAGRSVVAGGAAAAYSATALFSTSAVPRPCLPEWSVSTTGGAASITATGVLKTSNVATTTTATVRAKFGGKTKTRQVVIKPSSPAVSVRASVTAAREGGDPGQFRFSRTGSLSAPLTVNYSVSGTATFTNPNPALNDYTPLSGSITIPAGQSSTTVDVATFNDNLAEGRETVHVTLLADSSYRLSAFRQATVTIEDDETVPEGQPDIILGYKKRPLVGEGVFTKSPDFQVGVATEQEIEVSGRKDKTETFGCTIRNPGTTAQSYRIRGAPGVLGYAVRYFINDTEITGQVVADTFVTNVPPGGNSDVIIQITPTIEAGIGTWYLCELRARNVTTDTLTDFATVEVYRVK